jgi:hypothetical protein
VGFVVLTRAIMSVNDEAMPSEAGVTVAGSYGQLQHPATTLSSTHLIFLICAILGEQTKLKIYR